MDCMYYKVIVVRYVGHLIVAPYPIIFVNSIEIDKYRHLKVVICFHPHGVLVYAQFQTQIVSFP